MQLMKRALSIFLILMFCALAGCASTEDKAQLLSFGNEGPYIPKNPQLFIPGLGFTGEFWSKSKIAEQMRRNGWVYGGDIQIELGPGEILSEREIKIKDGDYKPGQFYTITFSDTQLPIIQQGRELAVAIDRVQQLNHADKIVLVGHSMGGLAAREYMQSDYYGDDVTAYMSIGTPHLGSNYDLKKPILRLVPKFIRDMAWKVDEQGDAVRDLRTNSIYLNGGNEADSDPHFRSKDINGNGTETDDIIGLNEMDKRPLPYGVFYISVIGGGNAVISTMKQASNSDGIVDIDSQDLNEVPDINVLSFVIVSPSDHFGQADDIWIFMQAARLRQYMRRFAKLTGIPPGSTEAKPQILEDESLF